MTGSVAERTEARRRLGYLPQEVGLPRRSTAFDFLDYLAVLKEWTNTPRPGTSEVLRVLDLVELGSLGGKRVSALSGGQRRRLSIAQALMGDPTLVILDEPTTGLDPEQRASLRGLLSEQARTSGVLLATHQTEDVAALCDRVIVLDGGAVCFDGTVPELVATAAGQVWVGDEANEGALSSWRTGSGAVRSIGGLLGPTPSSSSRRWRTRISSCARPPDPRRSRPMTQSLPATYAGERSALATLARHEIVAYAKHPLFLVGLVLAVVP